MSGYLRGFTSTGAPAVDAILDVISRAGDAYHSTSYWCDPIEEGGESWFERIQNAANAAGKLRTSDGEVDYDWQAEHVPPAVRMALRILLNHVAPGWDNCAAVVQLWLDQKLDWAVAIPADPSSKKVDA